MSTVSARGPLFDGTAPGVIHDAVLAGEERVAQVAVDRVHGRLGQVLKHPTGRYSSRVVVDVSVADRPVITDGGVVYGPWLEGVSSRNTRSRFKGYRTFRIVAQELAADAAEIAGPVVADGLKGLQ